MKPGRGDEYTSTLVQQRRALFVNSNVIAVMLTVGDGMWIQVEPNSFTDDPDPAIKGLGGQVSFLTRDECYSPELVLTYTHFIAAVRYAIAPDEELTNG